MDRHLPESLSLVDRPDGPRIDKYQRHLVASLERPEDPIYVEGALGMSMALAVPKLLAALL